MIMEQLFEFKEFIEELREDLESSDTIKEYEQHVESLEKIEDVRETRFYKDILSQYNIPSIDYFLGDEIVLGVKCDKDLLLRLIFASLSCSYEFVLDREWQQSPSPEIKIKLGIMVSVGGKDCMSWLDELHFFQVFRLFEIYTQEQIDMAVIKAQGDEELEQQQKERVMNFNNRLNTVLNEARTYLLLSGIRQDKLITT